MREYAKKMLSGENVFEFIRRIVVCVWLNGMRKREKKNVLFSRKSYYIFCKVLAFMEVSMRRIRECHLSEKYLVQTAEIVSSEKKRNSFMCYIMPISPFVYALILGLSISIGFY